MLPTSIWPACSSKLVLQLRHASSAAIESLASRAPRPSLLPAVCSSLEPWLVILMGFLGIVALVGFYDALRVAGPVMILAPILGAVGPTLVTVSHLVPIGGGLRTSAGLRVRRSRWTGDA